MNQEFDFFKATMPKTRMADYYIGCLDSSVFMDFNKSDNDIVSLVRISFDGYGCCDLDDKAECLNQEDSKEFIRVIEQENVNQEAMTILVKKIIRINKDHIWANALRGYGLLEEK